MSWIKLIFINIFITFSLLGMLLLLPPIASFIYSLALDSKSETSSQDARASLDLYNGIEWAHTHFKEHSTFVTTYYDYISWRRDDFEGETINIVDGLRVTKEPDNISGNAEHYLFFGGSTTWGMGVNDENTYPSIFAERLNTYVTNFGETGYVARQSLALLTNFLVNNSMLDLSGQHIVFYDGVNDVAHRCRSEINGLGTGREQQIRSILSKNLFQKYSFEKSFEQLTQFMQAITRRLGIVNASNLVNNTYACSLDPIRAEEVAKTLVETWQVTSDIVKERGGRFTAILQPVAFIGSPNIGNLDLLTGNNNIKNDILLGMQYETVYPLIRHFAASANIDFIDMSSVYDNCDNCYIDFCHVGPQAHQLLVDSLTKSINK